MRKKKSSSGVSLFRPIFLLICVLLISACGIAPIKSAFPKIPQNIDYVVDDENLRKVVFYNDASYLLYGWSNSAKINIYIDEKPLGQIDTGEYIQVALNPGKHKVRLAHWEVLTFKSIHSIEVLENTNIFRVVPNRSINLLERKTNLPKEFLQKK